MKPIITIILILITNLIFSQEKGTYQSDSIYKANKIKYRKWYSGSNKKLNITTFYDNEGRLIKYQLEPFVGGEQRTTYYIYDDKGLLKTQVDSTKNGKPNKKQLKQLEKLGLKSSIFLDNKNKPEVEVSKYEIVYDNNQIVKITQFNPDGSLDIVDYFKNNGLIKIREWYRNNEIYQVSTTEYLKKNLQKKYFGWEKDQDGNKTEWNYRFEYIFKNGQVDQLTRYDQDVEKETIKYYYNKKGLLIKTDGYLLEQFEYNK